MHWLSQVWLVMLIDASIKSLLLAGLASVLLRLTRVRNANVRHRVWTAVLVGMLALPALVNVTPTIPLPTWWLPEFAAADDQSGEQRGATEVTKASSDSHQLGSVEGPQNDPTSPWGNQSISGERRTSQAGAIPSAFTSEESLPETSASASSLSKAATGSTAGTHVVHVQIHGAVVIGAAYAGVAMAFLLRHLCGVLLSRRLVSDSQSLEMDARILTYDGHPCPSKPTSRRTRMCVVLWWRPKSPSRVDSVWPRPMTSDYSSLVALLENATIRVPLTIGFWRPKILLPGEWRSWSEAKLSAVVAHEMAHIRRGDYLVNILAEVNRCLYWFHPLAWLLRDWLSELAEQNCDDAVIASTGDRTQYARHLLEVAGALANGRGRIAWPGAAMARKANVEIRIEAILDASRPLARRVGSLGFTLLLAIAIPAVLLAAALQLGPTERRPVEAETTQPRVVEQGDVVAAQNGTAETAPDQESAKAEASSTEFRGMIFVDGDKLPPGLRLFKSRVHIGKELTELVELPASTVSDDRSFSVQLENFPRNLEEGLPADRWIDFGIFVSAPGYGFGWTEHQDVASGHPVALRLVMDDVPIRGRILDSEGRPVTSARIKIGRIDSGTKESLDEWLEAVGRSESANQIRKHLGRSISFPGEDIPLKKLGLLEHVATDPNGRFEIRGVGRERIATLVVEGSTVSRTEFRVATRDMQPVEFVANKTSTNARHERVYGASADLVTMPALRIEGTVRDAATGEPLAGVTVRTSQLNGVGGAYYPAFEAITDGEGHYQIGGFPLTGDHRILAVPADDQPYFMREAAVPQTDGPGTAAVTIDFELHRGIWVTGRVTDSTTGTPVQAALHYLPFLDNTYAQELPEFSEYGNGSTHFARHQHRYQTDTEGNYRLVGLPGRAIVGVDAYAAFRNGIGADKIDGLDEEGKFATYDNPIQAGRNWPSAMKEINPDEGASEVRVDFELQRGDRQQVRIVSPEGHPLSEVQVAGLTPSPSVDFERRSLPSSTVEAIGLAPGEKRTLLIFLREMNYAGIAEIDMSAERPEVLQVQLNTGGSIMGRLLDAEGNPLATTTIEAWTQLGDKGVRLPGVVTDKGGNFLCIGMPAPWKYELRVEGSRTVATDVDIQPGETLEVDDLQLGKLFSGGRQVGKRIPPKAKANLVAFAAQASPQRSATGTQPEKTKLETAPLVYEGQVLTPDGKPARRAKVYLVYWTPTPAATGMRKPEAVTDGQGRFRFALRRSDFPSTSDSVPPWQWASIVAAADGYGMAWTSSVALETTGGVIEEFKQDDRAAERLEPLLKSISQDRGPLRLVPDDVPIRGRVVTTEGTGIVAARVTLLEARTSSDGSLADWEQAAKESDADFLGLEGKVSKHIHGPHVPSLIPTVNTDDEGRFVLRGIGRDRIVKLLIEGPEIETKAVYARTRVGDTIEVPFQRELPDYRTITYFGANFAHVALPSKPVVGVVRDNATQRPLAGIMVRSHEYTVHKATGTSAKVGNEHVWAKTDKFGRFRLTGLPRVHGNPLEFQASGEAAYLPAGAEVDTSGSDLEPVTKDVELARGVWLEGRATDAVSRVGLAGYVKYVPHPKNPHTEVLQSMQRANTREPRSDMQGRFRIVVPPGPGYVGFRSFDFDRYPSQAAPPVEPFNGQVVFMSFAVGGAFNAVKEFDASADAETVRLDFQLSPGRTVKGIVLDSDGQPLSGALYVGRSRTPGWYPLAGNRFVVNSYDPGTPRRLVFLHPQRLLAGTYVLSGEPKVEPQVTLQPSGAIKGRVVDERGEPLADVVISSGSHGRQVQPQPGGMIADADIPIPLPASEGFSSGRYITDDEGRFVIAGIAPGLKYDLTGRYGHAIEPKFGNLAHDVVLGPGETKDLGEVKLQPTLPPRPVTAPGQVSVEPELTPERAEDGVK